MPTIQISCPKCGKKDMLDLNDELLELAKRSGLARIGFIHRDHVLILDIDTSFAVRGAYLNVMEKLFPNIKLMFRDYKVIFYPQIKVGAKLVVFYPDKHFVDIRACGNWLPNIYDILLVGVKIAEKARKYSWYRGETRLFGENIDVASTNTTTILFSSAIDNWRKKTQILKSLCKELSANNTLEAKKLEEILKRYI